MTETQTENQNQNDENESEEENGSVDSDGGTQTLTSDETKDLSKSSKIRYYVQRGTLVILLVIGFIAAVRFYLSASSAIDYWVSEAYVDVFQAAFNLVVLLFVSIGVTRQVRKIS